MSFAIKSSHPCVHTQTEAESSSQVSNSGNQTWRSETNTQTPRGTTVSSSSISSAPLGSEKGMSIRYTESSSEDMY